MWLRTSFIVGALILISTHGWSDNAKTEAIPCILYQRHTYRLDTEKHTITKLQGATRRVKLCGELPGGFSNTRVRISSPHGALFERSIFVNRVAYFDELDSKTKDFSKGGFAIVPNPIASILIPDTIQEATLSFYDLDSGELIAEGLL